MKKRTILKIILLILILIFTFLIIKSTYSKYLTATDDNASLHIANWNIKLNDEDIKENKDFTESIQLVFDENDYIDNSVIAPTSRGSFKVKIESTGTELPFQYILQIAEEQNPDSVSDAVLNKADIPDFRIYSYTLNGSAPITVDDSNKTISDIVEPPIDADGNFTGEEVIFDYTFYFEWYDGVDNILDNQNDVLVSKSNQVTSKPINPKAVIPVSLKITQIGN